MPAHRPPAPPPAEPGSHLGQEIPQLGHVALTPGQMTGAAVLTLVVGSFFISVFLLQLGEGRASGAVEAWARANRFEVIKAAVVKNPRGPFRNRPAWQTVSAVTVRTPEGRNKSAWICWGNVFVLYLRQPTVEWDDAAGQRASSS